MTLFDKYYGEEVTEEVEKDIIDYCGMLLAALENAHAQFGQKCGGKGYRFSFLEIALASAISMFLEGKADRPLHQLLTHFRLIFNEMNDDLRDWIKDIDKDKKQ